MNPLYNLLAHLTKKLEQQADLDVVNKLLIIYFINITAIIATLVYGIFALQSKNYSLGMVLLGTTVLLTLNLIFFIITKKLNVTKAILTIIAALTLFYLLYSGGTSGLGMYWILVFPVFIIPLFGLGRGNLISFLFFAAAIAFFRFSNDFMLFRSTLLKPLYVWWALMQ